MREELGGPKFDPPRPHTGRKGGGRPRVRLTEAQRALILQALRNTIPIEAAFPMADANEAVYWRLRKESRRLDCRPWVKRFIQECNKAIAQSEGSLVLMVRGRAQSNPGLALRLLELAHRKRWGKQRDREEARDAAPMAVHFSVHTRPPLHALPGGEEAAIAQLMADSDGDPMDDRGAHTSGDT